MRCLMCGHVHVHVCARARVCDLAPRIRVRANLGKNMFVYSPSLTKKAGKSLSAGFTRRSTRRCEKNQDNTKALLPKATAIPPFVLSSSFAIQIAC